MNIREFHLNYQDEESCKAKWRALREEQGIICRKCGHNHHRWKKDREQWECKQCGDRMTLRSGTVMENSKLPYYYWFTAMAYLANTKKSISALELQGQLGHKRYEPIWAMLQKLRTVMGYRDSKYTLHDEIELDEAFFEAPSTHEKGEDHYSGDKIRVLVAVESRHVGQEGPKKHKKSKKVGYIKMKVLTSKQEGQQEGQVVKESESLIDNNAKVTTDGHKSYKRLSKIVDQHIAINCTQDNKALEILPWVHTAISNAKRYLAGVHHFVSKEYLQGYLNEFCYKFNRRYMTSEMFERTLICAISSPWYENRHRSG